MTPLPTPLTFEILREALWSAQISQREFETQCRLAGVRPDKVEGAVKELREFDGVEQ